MQNTFQDRLFLIVIILLIWIAFVSQLNAPWFFLSEYYYFFLLGLTGALVANATGAGGGIVFIPFFAAYGLAEAQALATSILIQCFGMTVGSLSWLSKKSIIAPSSVQLNLMTRLLVVGGVFTIIGVLLAQYVLNEYDMPLTLVFRIFSIIFGLVLLYLSLRSRSKLFTRYHLEIYDYILVTIACVLGGITTAWISIGVGECIAIVLILRNFPTMVAVAAGVCMSSIAVLVAMPLHYMENINIEWNIVLMAAPAVVIGGAVARLISVKLGADRLKIVLAIWILITGLVM